MELMKCEQIIIDIVFSGNIPENTTINCIYKEDSIDFLGESEYFITITDSQEVNNFFDGIHDVFYKINEKLTKLIIRDGYEDELIDIKEFYKLKHV
jgi:hypothetical protein